MPYIGDVKKQRRYNFEGSSDSRWRRWIIDQREYQMDAAVQQHNATMNREIANTDSRIFWAIGLGFRVIGYWWWAITRGLWGEHIGLGLAIVLLISTFVSDTSDSVKANGPFYFALYVVVGSLAIGTAFAFAGGLVERFIRVVINVIQWMMKQFNKAVPASEAQEAPLQTQLSHEEN